MTPSYYIASAVYRFRLRPPKSFVRSLGSIQMMTQVSEVPVPTSVSDPHCIPGIRSRAGETEGECWQKNHTAGEQHPRGSLQMESSVVNIAHVGCRLDPG